MFYFYTGDADEFMFSCTDCCFVVGSRLVRYGNRWGFVQVGVYNKGFVEASMDTWALFGRVGLEPLIDSDLTSSFCFLCAVAGGSAAALTGGAWAFVVHRDYATEVSIYAFLIGYYMVTNRPHPIVFFPSFHFHVTATKDSINSENILFSHTFSFYIKIIC